MQAIVDTGAVQATRQVSGLAHFNGVTEGFDVPADATSNWGPTQSFSVECWLKTDGRITQKPNQVVLGRDEWARRSGSQLHWWLGLWGKDPENPALTGRAAFVLRDNQGNQATLSGTKRLDNCRWHHLSGVRDAASGQVILYVDDKREASTPANFPAGFSATVSPLNVGWLNHAMHGGSNHFYRFRGTVDNVQIRNHAVRP
jgi:hypothetical protein